jgi:hypothetical protein
VRDLARLADVLLAVPLVVPVVRTPHAAAPAAVVTASKTVIALNPVTVTAWNPVNVTNTVASNVALDLPRVLQVLPDRPLLPTVDAVDILPLDSKNVPLPKKT